MPTVAVVIPYYCNKAHVIEAVESVLSQSRLPDEIIVVDDASPDGAEVLSSLDPRIVVIHHETNQGAGAARQTGVEATTSEWIAFLDADDVWLPTKLERQLTDIEGRPELAVHHVGLVSFRADGSRVEYIDKPTLLNLPAELRRNRALPSALMMRRIALEQVGGWSADRRIMEDWDLGIRIVAAGGLVGFLAEPLVLFRRMNHGNLSSRGVKHMFILLRTIIRHRRLFHRELGIRGTLGVAGRVIHDEGCRRGSAGGLMLRFGGRVVALGAPFS